MAYNILVQAAVVVISLIVSTNSLNIAVKTQVVGPNDENVVVTCAGGYDNKNMSEKILGMRLMKLDGNDQWTEIAALRSDETIGLYNVNATAVGRLGDVLDSSLVVTWTDAAHDISGRYRCDAIILTRTWAVDTEESRELVVKSRSTDPDTVQNWPAGNFTLVMPSDGCPRHPAAWIKSFIKMKVPSVDKYYPLDVPLHLAHPHKKDGFIYRQFCTLPASTERSEPWPAGSYCIYEVDRHDICPTGFKYAQPRIQIPSDKGNTVLYYYPDRISHFRVTDFTGYGAEVCCRHDGNASTPIELPATHPFYLLRHGGRCQEVKGMDVTQDVFMMETADDGENDKWVHAYAGFYPDISLKPYKEELCYYSRKKV